MALGVGARRGTVAAEEEGEGTRTLRLGKMIMGKCRPYRVRKTRWGIFLEWQVVKRFTGHFIIQMVLSGCLKSETRGWPMMVMVIMMRVKNKDHRRFIIIVIIVIRITIVIVTIVIIIRTMFTIIITEYVF